jgi:Fe2+ or Zn2+ uptake regulation protein
MVPRAQMSSASEPNEPAVDLVVALVLAYLAGHPHAADSPDGVARWWLGDDGRFSVAEVERALERLVAAGHLRRQKLADGTRLYAALRGDATAPGAPQRPPHLH